MSKKGTQTITYDSEKAVRSALWEILIYLIFLIATTIVALSTRHLFMFYFNRTIKMVFIDRDSTTTRKFNLHFGDISTTAEWFSFLEHNFLDDLHVNNNETYKNLTVDSDGNFMNIEPARIFLDENLLLGPPRLRQIRVLEGSCRVPDVFRKYFKNCYNEYSQEYEDTRQWYKGSKFRTLSEVNARPIWGHINEYYGAGYVTDLSYDRETNLNIIDDLRSKQWIDRGTRMVVIEFGLYNANTDLFDNVKLIAELPSTGGILPSSRLQAVKLYNVWTQGNYVVIIAGIIFYSMGVYYILEEVGEIMKFGCHNYLSSIWNYLDIFIILLVTVSFVYNIWHPIYLSIMLEQVKKHPEAYHSLDIISYWNLIYMNVMAICCFFVWIKIFKFISFNKTMLQFSTTLRRCSKDLLGFAVMFFIVFIAYAQLGFLLFGNTHPDFRNFKDSLITMMRMVLGDFEYTAIEQANRVLGPIYFLTYILLVFFILLNMFLAIINDTYSDVKNEVIGGPNYLLIFIQKFLDQVVVRLYKHIPEKLKKMVKSKDKDGDTGKDSEKKTEQGKNKSDDVDSVESDETLKPGTSNMTRQTGTEPLRVRRSDIIKNYFEEVDETPATGNDKLRSLNTRVNLLEAVLEQLIGNMDQILKKVESKKRPGGH